MPSQFPRFLIRLDCSKFSVHFYSKKAQRHFTVQINSKSGSNQRASRVFISSKSNNSLKRRRSAESIIRDCNRKAWTYLRKARMNRISTEKVSIGSYLRTPVCFWPIGSKWKSLSLLISRSRWWTAHSKLRLLFPLICVITKKAKNYTLKVKVHIIMSLFTCPHKYFLCTYKELCWLLIEQRTKVVRCAFHSAYKPRAWNSRNICRTFTTFSPQAPTFPFFCKGTRTFYLLDRKKMLFTPFRGKMKARTGGFFVTAVRFNVSFSEWKCS